MFTFVECFLLIVWMVLLFGYEMLLLPIMIYLRNSSVFFNSISSLYSCKRLSFYCTIVFIFYLPCTKSPSYTSVWKIFLSLLSNKKSLLEVRFGCMWFFNDDFGANIYDTFPGWLFNMITWDDFTIFTRFYCLIKLTILVLFGSKALSTVNYFKSVCYNGSFLF